MRGERDLKLERAWRQRVRKQASSELSVRAFCKQQGLAESAFYFWRRELQRRDTEPRDAVIASWPANGQPPFVPIVISESVEPTSRTGELASTGRIELVHPGGIVIRVPAGCALAALRPILDLLDDRERGPHPC